MVPGVYLTVPARETEMDQPSSTEGGITLRIRFKADSLGEFMSRYGADVSPGGIFVKTKEPLGVGSPMRFEFSLNDGTPLLVGTGTVVWVRDLDPARPEAVPGMGIRFDQLTPASQHNLNGILAGKARASNGV